MPGSAPAPWWWSKTETGRGDIYVYFNINFNVFFKIKKCICWWVNSTNFLKSVIFVIISLIFCERNVVKKVSHFPEKHAFFWTAWPSRHGLTFPENFDIYLKHCPFWEMILTFRHRASSTLGQAFRYSPENAFYIFNQQIYFIIWYLLGRASLI